MPILPTCILAILKIKIGYYKIAQNAIDSRLLVLGSSSGLSRCFNGLNCVLPICPARNSPAALRRILAVALNL